MNLRNIWAIDQQSDFNQTIEIKKEKRSFLSSPTWLAVCLCSSLILAGETQAQTLVDTTLSAPSCGPGSGLTFHALSFSTITAIGNNTYRLPLAGVINGVQVDVLAQFDAPLTNRNGTPPRVAGDEFSFTTDSVRTVTYTVVRTGTITPVSANFRLRMQDVDFDEIIRVSSSEYANLIVGDPTNLTITESGGISTITGASGRRDDVAEDTVELIVIGASSFQMVNVNSTSNSGFRLDGDLDAPLNQVACLETGLTTVKTLSSGDSTPNEGDTVSFQIAVTNESTVNATNVSLTDALPSGLTLTGSTASGSTTYNSSNGLWSIGSLAAGASATLTLSGRVNTGQAGNSITNTTTAATGDQSDPSTIGDDLTETIVIANDIEAGDNDFSSTPFSSTGGTTTTVFTDDTINGNSFANSGVIPTIADDDGLTGVSINSSGIITVPSGTTPGTYNIEYQICEDGNPTNCDTAIATIVVTALADLSITKTNTPGVNGEIDQANDTVTTGSTTNYTIVVTNNGPDSVTGAVVTDTPTAGITCPATNAVTITGNGVPAGSFTFNDLANGGIALGTLDDGQSATLTYSCTVN